MNSLSIIYPVYNEEEVLEKNLRKTLDYLRNVDFLWEIIIVDNGSTDQTIKILQEFNKTNSNIQVYRLEQRGLGLAISEGIKNSKYSFVMFYAIDLPFGLDVIQNSLDCAINTDSEIVIGSKAEKNSINNAPTKRKIASFVYNYLLGMLFNLKIKDTQGSLLFRRDKINQILKFCMAGDAFYCTQIIIYGHLFGFKIKEISVNYTHARSGSKVSIIRDGYSLGKQLFAEYINFRKIKNTLA